MITKPLTSKDSRQSRAWFALAASLSLAGTESAFATEMDIAAPLLEANPPLIESLPEPTSLIPGDKPIGALLLSKHHPLLLRADFSRINDYVTQIYQNAHFEPIWLTPNRSEKNLQDLLGILQGAPKDGLKPANYDADRIKEWIGSQDLDGNTTANYDVAMTISLVRFLQELRHGQIEPRELQRTAHMAAKPALDVAGLLQGHLENQNLPELVSQFEPKAKQYQQLKQILNRSQPLAGQANGAEFNPKKLIRPGDRHAQIPLLRQRLQAMGVLSAAGDNDSKLYDDALVAAIKTIQQQQGLKADGVIGAATAALFHQTHSDKTAQIELAMERARWIPDMPDDGPMILVNIPAFELWAFNSANDPNPVNMKVIVGKAPDNQTPLLWEEMKYLEFMPYWNIPTSIFKKEIMPKAANNQGYLASQEIELIRHQNSEQQGGGSYLRARQRPGKKNPLGRVKFVFPNTADVYLHDTPSHAAFNRPRRDLSHGCVRVSEPERLAEFVLGDQQGWDKESILQAMSAPKTRHVTLKRSVPVLFYYGTTFVDHENQLRFYPDVYGQDEQLRQALQRIQTPSAGFPNAAEQLAKTGTSNLLAGP